MRYLTLLVATAALALAAAPAATVSSDDSVEIAGTAVSFVGIPSWPVLEGDTVKASSRSATLLFRNGSRVVLGPYSQARLTSNGGNRLVQVITGSIQYDTRPGVQVALEKGSVVEGSGSLGKPVQAAQDTSASAPVPKALPRLSRRR